MFGVIVDLQASGLRKVLRWTCGECCFMWYVVRGTHNAPAPSYCMSFYSLHRLELLHKMLGGRNDMGGEGVWLCDRTTNKNLLTNSVM